MFKAALVLLTAFYFVSPAQATTAIPTNIVNSDKAVFVGSLVTANTNSNAVAHVAPAGDELVIGFLTMESCKAFIAAFSSQIKFSGAGATNYVTSSWAASGYQVLVGNCYDK